MSLKEVARLLKEQDFAPCEAQHLERILELEGWQSFRASWKNLVQDQHMGDGGCYRYRRYGTFLWKEGELTPLEERSILQKREHNALNGGVVRTFEGLEPDISQGEVLRDLIEFDFEHLPLEQEERHSSWKVGVHQVRILAKKQEIGKPTPEGIHIDAESYTIQHFIARENISGGVFRAYDSDKKKIYEWLQKETLDTLFFTGDLWHDASPIEVTREHSSGFRDILLIDFDPV